MGHLVLVRLKTLSEIAKEFLSPSPLVSNIPVGSRLPYLVTSMAGVMLADLSETELDHRTPPMTGLGMCAVLLTIPATAISWDLQKI